MIPINRIFNNYNCVYKEDTPSHTFKQKEGPKNHKNKKTTRHTQIELDLESTTSTTLLEVRTTIQLEPTGQISFFFYLFIILNNRILN